MSLALIIPAAAMSKEEVAVLRQQAQFQIAESTAIKKLGMKPNNKSNLPTKAFDKNGNQLFGRGVEKVSQYTLGQTDVRLVDEPLQRHRHDEGNGRAADDFSAGGKMTTVTTRQELIDALSAADLERWTKRSIYHDVTSGYTFGAANRDDLLTRKRKYPLYTYTMPDVFTINIDGELLEAMVKNAQQRVRAVAKKRKCLRACTRPTRSKGRSEPAVAR